MTALSQIISAAIPEHSKVLDIGCGDGKIDVLIKQRIPSVTIEGIDVLVRRDPFIKVTEFNGNNIPFTDKSFDVSLLIDVLHHTDDPSVLLNEAARVTKEFIVIKDHSKEGFLANLTLTIMDYIGNAHYGVRLPYNFLTLNQWDDLYEQAGLKIHNISRKLGLYPVPLTYFFDRKLHFIVILGVANN